MVTQMLEYDNLLEIEKNGFSSMVHPQICMFLNFLSIAR